MVATTNRYYPAPFKIRITLSQCPWKTLLRSSLHISEKRAREDLSSRKRRTRRSHLDYWGSWTSLVPPTSKSTHETAYYSNYLKNRDVPLQAFHSGCVATRYRLYETVCRSIRPTTCDTSHEGHFGRKWTYRWYKTDRACLPSPKIGRRRSLSISIMRP